MVNNKNFFRKLFESIDEGEVEKPPTKDPEHELVIYAKVGNFEGLQTAQNKESHEQWEMKAAKGRVRIRKTIKEGLAPQYELTFKSKSNAMGIDGNIEETFKIEEKMFLAFKELTEQGMFKDRFMFPVNMVQISNGEGLQDIHVSDMFYEVDIFFSLDHDGNKSYKPWCKIDLELDPLMKQIQRNHPDIGEFTLKVKTVNLPFNPSGMLLSTDDEVTVKEQITRLYDDYFLTKK